MKIQFASDLHLEFPHNREFLKTNPFTPEAEVLLLAGDIVPFAVMHKHMDFFDYVSDNFRNTFWVPGNHEYYHYDLVNKRGMLHEMIKKNVHLVNNVSVQQDDIRFIFSTLWSKITPTHQWKIVRGISDFHLIKNRGRSLTAETFNELHAESLAFITRELAEDNTGKTVVVTHHLPTFFNYPDMFRGDVLNEAFATELFDFIETGGPDSWVFGHHHFQPGEFKIGQTKLYTNQLGYVKLGEHLDFNPRQTMDL